MAAKEVAMPSDVDEGRLRQLYLVEGKTSYEVATALGVSPATAQRRLRNLGIPLRGPKECHSKPPEKKACAGCGKEMEVGGRGRPKKSQRFCSNSCRMLNENPSPHGHSSHAPRPRKHKETLHDKEWLYQKYVVEELSTSDIGKMLGCPRATVKWTLKKFGIAGRSQANARKILFDRRGRKDVSQADLITAYGSKCACCGETEPAFLTLDHIGGGGSAHRREMRAKNKGNVHLRIRQELKAQGWPKDKYRLLCMNCNFATRHKKACPHQLKKEAAVPPAANPTPDPKAVRTVAELIAVLLTMPPDAVVLGTWEGIATGINEVCLDDRGRVLIDVDQC
jgi:transposase-like protein